VAIIFETMNEPDEQRGASDDSPADGNATPEAAAAAPQGVSPAAPNARRGDGQPKRDDAYDDDKPPAAKRAKQEPAESKLVPRRRKTKVYRSKKPKDMPRRPMSAYNAFFKDERVRLLEEAKRQAERSGEGKVGFESMAHTIAARWRKLTSSDIGPYQV